MTATLFTNARIFDGTGSAAYPGEVLVEGDRIIAVAAGREHIDRTRAGRVVDGKGGTVMPGLIEPHAHLTFAYAIDRTPSAFVPPPDEHAACTAHNAKTILEHGYTSAFSGGSTRPNIEVAVRDDIAAGRAGGPRLKAASFERSLNGAIGVRDVQPGVAGIEQFARDMIECGVDSMKFILSGAGNLNPDTFQTLEYDDAELAAAARIANEAGLKLVGHAYSSESIRMALRHGFHAIYHCNFADEETLDAMEAQKDEYFCVPAPSILIAGIRGRDRIPPFMPEAKPEGQAALATLVDAQRALLPKLRARGIRVLPGGDYGFPHNPHGRNAWDLELFVTEFGFTPAEVLAAATRDGGAVMGMADRLGLIKPGYIADILLIDGDPLADISILQRRERISAIMQNGAFYRQPEPAGTTSLSR